MNKKIILIIIGVIILGIAAYYVYYYYTSPYSIRNYPPPVDKKDLESVGPNEECQTDSQCPENYVCMFIDVLPGAKGTCTIVK